MDNMVKATSLDGQRFYQAMEIVISLPKDMQDRFISEVKEQQRASIMEDICVGSIVKINHKKVPSSDQFRVTKINRKNVKCKKLNGNMIYTVSPQLLEVIG